jgi:hypothetical protein
LPLPACRRSRVGAFVFALVLMGVAAAAPSALATPPPLFSSSAVALSGTTGTTQTGRLFRDNVPSTCASPKAPAPVAEDTGAAHHFASFGTTATTLNGTDNPICVTVTTTSHCAAGKQIESTSYRNSFTPANVRTNYLGDLGRSPDATGQSYSFNVLPGTQFVTIVSEFAAGTGCSSFDISAVPDRPYAIGGAQFKDVPLVGKTMTAIDPAWQGTPVEANNWRRCDLQGAACVDIPGATANTYTPTDSDLGHTLRYRATATDGETSSSETLPKTVGIPLPSTTGTLGASDPMQQGRLNRLTPASQCDPPKFNPGPFTTTGARAYDDLAFQNLTNEPACVTTATSYPACGNNFFTVGYAGAFDPAHIAVHYAGDPGGSSAAPTGFAFPVPAGSPFHLVVSQVDLALPDCNYMLEVGTVAPFATSLPAVTGAPGLGPFTVSDGTWSGTPAFARQWRRCDAAGNDCTDIAGATAASYTPSSDDIGHTLRARVSATQGGQTASADSAAASGPPPPPPPPPSSEGNNVPPLLDRSAPTLGLKLSKLKLKKLLEGGFVPVVASCNEACSFSADLLADAKLVKRLHLAALVKVGSGKAKLGAGARKTVKVKLTRKARKGLKKARKVSFTLRTSATDAAGNVTKRPVRLTVKK